MTTHPTVLRPDSTSDATMIAHSDGKNAPHLLRDHLLAVADLAALNAAGIVGGEPWARIAGR